MRTQVAAALAGLLVVGAPVTVGATPAPSCPTVPPAALDSALATVPAPVPDGSWRAADAGSSADCALRWVRLDTVNGRRSAPVQVLLFDREGYIGTATPSPHPFTQVVDSPDPDTVVIRFRWLAGDESSAEPGGEGDVRYRLAPDGGAQPLDPLPDPVED